MIKQQKYLTPPPSILQIRKAFMSLRLVSFLISAGANQL